VRRGFENGDGLFWEIQLQSLTGSSLIFANSVFSAGFNSKFTTFNEVSLMTIRAHGEDLLNKPLSLTAHPLQTQIINSSIHATTFRRRLHTSHGLLLAAAAANSYNPLETPPSIDSATFIINAMPGSLDPLFDVLHGEGLILSKFASKLQLPLQLRRKILTTKM